MTFALDLRLRSMQLAIASAALLFGALAALNPLYAAVAILAAVFVVVVLTDMAIGLAVFTVVTFVESVPNPLGTLSAAKLVGLLIAFAWLVKATAGRDAHTFSARHPVPSIIFVALAMWVVLSLLWSEQRAPWFDSTQSWVLDLALFPIMYIGLRKREHVRWLFMAFVAGAFLSVLYGVVTGATSNVDGRLGGAGLGPNLLGPMAAAGSILAIGLIGQREWSSIARGLAAAAAAACVVTVFLTASREAILGLAVALVVAPLVARRGRRAPAVGISIAAALSVAILVLAFAPASARQRLFSASYSSGSGRTDIWQVGLRMVKANPLEGVGAGNFPVASIHYLIQPGALQFTEYIVDQPKVAHNIYLEVIAELGIVGLLLFLALAAFCVRCAWTATKVFERKQDSSGELLARCLLLALIGLLVTDFFSSALLAKQLWLLLAAAPALLSIAEAHPRPRIAAV